MFVGHFCPPGSGCGSRDPTESGSTALSEQNHQEFKQLNQCRNQTTDTVWTKNNILARRNWYPYVLVPMSRDFVWLKGRKLKRDDPFHMAQQYRYRYNMPIILPLGLGTTTLSWICYIPLPSYLALLNKTSPAGYYGYQGVSPRADLKVINS
jgi:hypothetical protein